MTEQQFLRRLASDYFGPGVDSPATEAAWRRFHRAGRHYPLGSNKFLYYSPLNRSLVYPLNLRFEGKPMGPAWLDQGLGDRLEDTLDTYTLDEIIEMLGKLSTAWAKALETYGPALAPAAETKRARTEFATAGVGGCCFRSAWNVYRWYRARRGRRSENLRPAEREIVADELATLHTALPLVQADRRFGFHGEAQVHMFDAPRIRRKISRLEQMLHS